MGGAVSTNVINMITNTIANISSDIIQKTKLSQDSSQIISVSNIDGDVIIKGNVFYQRASINMTALMKALSTEAAQQDLIYQISQEAKSLVSGLNIAQFADATNTVNLLMNTTINMLTTINQTCAALMSQRQEIIVKRVKGNVYIQDNVFNQVADIISYCTQNVVSNNSAMQDLKVKLDQTASATADGLSLWGIAILAAIVIGVPVIGGVIGGKAILKYIFPLVAVVGIVLLGLYFYWTKTDMKQLGFSTFIGSTPICVAKKLGESTTEYDNVVDANAACFKNDTCVAFDWQGITVKPDGTYDPTVPPITTFYESISNGCSDNIKQDKIDIIHRPVFHVSAIDPKGDEKDVPEGDAFLNTTTSVWFQKTDGRWQTKGTLIDVAFNKLLYGTVPPASTLTGGDYYLYYSPANPLSMYLYKRVEGTNGSRWDQVMKMAGPGLIPTAPKVTNASGFKVENKKKWLLYFGITGIALGVMGTVITIVMIRKENAKKE